MMMMLTKSAALVPCMLLVTSAMGFAQQPPDAPQAPRERIYVSAATGASIGPQTAAVFAGEFGERMHRNVQAYLTISYHENLMDSGLRGDLSLLSAGLTSATGVPWRLRGRDRGVSLVAGARYLIGESSVRPYVGGGAGVINLKRTISDAQVGDVTSAVLTEFGIGESALTSEALTRPLVEASVGVAIAAGRATYIDLGYRFRRAFHLSESLDFGQLSAGIGVRF
jgi:hypothetical protein